MSARKETAMSDQTKHTALVIKDCVLTVLTVDSERSKIFASTEQGGIAFSMFVSEASIAVLTEHGYAEGVGQIKCTTLQLWQSKGKNGGYFINGKASGVKLVKDSVRARGVGANRESVEITE